MKAISLHRAGDRMTVLITGGGGFTGSYVLGNRFVKVKNLVG
jgi:hypothetical protein